MSRDNVENLLNECLSAYETGLSPEECLSAFPGQRDFLEPMFRQALSLRFAYSAVPSEEYRRATHERLMFAAGRDVTQAMVDEPDEAFVSHAKQRFLNAAGASAQEALRAVPPPRLPFWMNARRRLLEAAATTPAPTIRPMAVFMRVGLSAAVVVLAMTLAGLAYLTSQSKPTSVGAQLADIESQLNAVEQQQSSGHIVPPGVLVDLTRRTNDLVQKLNSQPPATAVADKLPNIIERQKDVVDQAVVDSGAPPELEQAKQQLDTADQGVKLLAARADAPTSTSTSAASSATTPSDVSSAFPTVTSTAVASATPAVTGTPVPTATAVQGEALQIHVSPSDSAIGLIWVEIKTDEIRFLVPDSWQIRGVSTGVGGQATLTSNFLSFSVENATILVDMRDGGVNVLVGNDSFVLRTSGIAGRAISPEQLVKLAGTLAPQMQHFVDSLEMADTATVTPTPPTTNTSTVTPSKTP